jgi:hypothetical protein
MTSSDEVPKMDPNMKLSPNKYRIFIDLIFEFVFVDDGLSSYPLSYRFSFFVTRSIVGSIQLIFVLFVEACPKFELKSVAGYITFLQQQNGGFNATRHDFAYKS